MPPKSQALNVANEYTMDQAKSRLLDAATRLFALHGIDGVTLKDIVAAAGQKNQSAVQYYFRDKDGLIAAAILTRFEAIDARRADMLAAVASLPGTERRRAVMRAIVEPIVIEVETHPLGPSYVRFLAQALQKPGAELEAIVTRQASPGFVALNAAVAEERGQRWPRAMAEQRMRISAALTMGAIADWVAQGFGPTPRERLIDMLATANEAIILT